MWPIASRLLVAFVLIEIAAAPIFADDIGTGSHSRTFDAPVLPEFVSSASRTDFAQAVGDNSPSIITARHAAEALSAKFSDITTGSISNNQPAPATKADVSVVPAEPSAGRSIVLASNQSEDPKAALDAVESRPSRPDKVNRIPRKAVRKASIDPGSREPRDSSEELRRIGQKVGFFDLLTNPAFWQSK